MPPGFYNPYDQQVYDAGFKYIPQSRYLLNPFQIPTDDSTTTPPNTGGITTLPTGGGGGGGSTYTGTIGGLTSDFFNTISDRQDRLTELNRPLDPGTFNVTSNLTGGGRLDPMGSGYYDTLNRLEARDPSGYKMSTFNKNFAPSGEVVSSIDYNPRTNPNIKKAFFESVYQSGPQVFDAEKPTFSRRIQDALYSTPFFDKPQTADQIIADGYTGKVGGPGILGIMAGMVDKYGDLPRGDQAFIARNMGYTGPTVFGKNTGRQDPFGLNVRSGFGNYAEAVGKQVDKLGAALGVDGAIGGKKDFQGATFNPTTGLFESDELSPQQIAELNRRTKMVRAKYKFYVDQTKQRDIDRKAAEEAEAAAAAAAAKRERDFAAKGMSDPNDPSRTGASGRRPGSGGTVERRDSGPDRNTDDTGQTYDSGGRQGFGYGLADGGRVYYMDGGLADMLEIYD